MKILVKDDGLYSWFFDPKRVSIQQESKARFCFVVDECTVGYIYPIGVEKLKELLNKGKDILLRDDSGMYLVDELK